MTQYEQLSDNAKKAIDHFIKWINECKQNNVYGLHYTMFPDDKNEHQPYAVCISKTDCAATKCHIGYDRSLSKLFCSIMIMNFVSFDEMPNLINFAHSKGYWSNKKYDGKWSKK